MRLGWIAGAAAGLALGGAAVGQEAAGVAGYDAGTVLARVDGTEITLGHVVALRRDLPEEYRDVPDPALLNILLGQLVEQTLLADSLSRDPAADPPGVRLKLENTRRQALAFEALNARVAGAADAAQVQAAYDAEIAAFAPATEWNAAHILVATEARAAELRAEIEGGADFADVARANSTDAGSSAAGGDLGWLAPGTLAPEFEAAVAATTPGGLAGPVQTRFGWHVIAVRETRATAPQSLEQARPRIAEALGQAAVQEALASMREGAAIEMNVTPIDPAAIRDESVLGR